MINYRNYLDNYENLDIRNFVLIGVTFEWYPFFIETVFDHKT